ncbi:MAG: sulfatase [Planctomycetota bacterium]
MNVIWFVIDTLRSDHLSCYNYFRTTSPNIDRLAAKGILFENSYSSAIATGPGFTSLFTGLAAINNGFYLTPWNVPNEPLLDDNIVTLPEIIQTRGYYTTAAFDNLVNFRSHMKQFVRGFEYYINITKSPSWLHHHTIAEEVNHRLLPWLEQHTKEQFFAFVHYWDPHTPYNMPAKSRGKFSKKNGDLITQKAPDGYEYVPGWGLADKLPAESDRYSIDLYDDEIFYTDYCLGLVMKKLEELGIDNNTVIVVTSDHGEDLDLHGLWGHATLHDTTIRVPLIIYDPKSKLSGKRITDFAQHVDNLPTILEYFPSQERPEFGRIQQAEYMPEIPEKFDGESLLALAEGKRGGRKEIVVETGEQRAYISPPWKLIWHKNGHSVELFNTANDPLELNDRSENEKETVNKLSEKLQDWVNKNLSNKRKDPIMESNGAWTCYIGKKGER